MTNQFLSNLFEICLYLAIIPIIFGAFLVIVNHNSKQMAATYFGYHSQIWLGFIGIIIHETSHLVVALIFRHTITKFRPLRIPNQNDPEDRALGYVSHSWNQGSFYQRLGNLFIGIAPIIGNTLAIWLVSEWLVPNALSSWQTYVTTHSVADLNFFSGATFGVLGIILWIALVVNICVGGFDLSRSDLDSSISGIIFFVVMLLGITAIVTFIMQMASIDTNLKSMMLPLYSAMVLAILISALTNLALRGIVMLKNR